jgi:hypothetical protein
MDGEVQWSREYDGRSLRSLVSNNHGGYAACGPIDTNWQVLQLSGIGNLRWRRVYEFENQGTPLGLASMDDDGYVLVGYGEYGPHPTVLRTD